MYIWTIYRVQSNPHPRQRKIKQIPQNGDGYLNFTQIRREHSGWYKCTSRHLNFQYSSIGYFLNIRCKLISFLPIIESFFPYSYSSYTRYDTLSVCSCYEITFAYIETFLSHPPSIGPYSSSLNLSISISSRRFMIAVWLLQSIDIDVEIFAVICAYHRRQCGCNIWTIRTRGIGRFIITAYNEQKSSDGSAARRHRHTSMSTGFAGVLVASGSNQSTITWPRRRFIDTDRCLLIERCRLSRCGHIQMRRPKSKQQKETRRPSHDVGECER